MRNDDFKKLVVLLETNPDMFHDFIMKGASNSEINSLLSDQARSFAAKTPGQAKLLNGLFKDEIDRASLLDAVASCIDSCEGSQQAGFGVLANASPDCPMTGCSCTNASTCTDTGCGVTTQFYDSERVGLFLLRPIGGLAVGCDPNSTVSGPCGGVTCGGSTCSVTCTEASCGNTCGNSCNYTTNFTQPIQDVAWYPQSNLWL